MDLTFNTFGIGDGSDMNPAPPVLDCGAVSADFCVMTRDCEFKNGVNVPTASKFDFLDAYPDCSYIFDETPGEEADQQQQQQPKKMDTKTLFDIKSPNFLGGQNVHNLVIIVLCVMILSRVTGKGALGAVVKGAKAATKA